MQTRGMTQQESEEFRAFYERLMEPWDTVSQSSDKALQESVWKSVLAQFDTVVTEIKQLLAKDNAEFVESEQKEVVLRVCGTNYVMGKDCNSKTIGRVPFTDIALASRLGGASRLHAVVHRFGNLLAIFDVGSYSGIICLERSNSDAPCEFSVRGDRRPLLIGVDETAVFALGPSVTLTVNPKECVIMSQSCTGTRNFKGQCGHFVCCVECAKEWRDNRAGNALCPQCREPFYGSGAEQHVEHANTMNN